MREKTVTLAYDEVKVRISGIRPQEYTRMALQEASRTGTHPFALRLIAKHATPSRTCMVLRVTSF